MPITRQFACPASVHRQRGAGTQPETRTPGPWGQAPVHARPSQVPIGRNANPRRSAYDKQHNQSVSLASSSRPAIVVSRPTCSHGRVIADGPSDGRSAFRRTRGSCADDRANPAPIRCARSRCGRGDACRSDGSAGCTMRGCSPGPVGKAPLAFRFARRLFAGAENSPWRR